MKQKPQINIFEGISTSRTMANKGIPDFLLPKKNDSSILGKDLLPLHNKKDDRFKTDIQLNGKTRFEESNTIIKSLEEEILTMKHKLSFVYEKDEEIGKLKGTINDLKKENKELQNYSSECMKLRMENKQLTLNYEQNNKLMKENKSLKEKIKGLIKQDEHSITDITDITDFVSDDSDYDSDYGSDDYDEEPLIDINIQQLRSVLFNRLQSVQKKHIDTLIRSYGFKKKNKVKKSVLEQMIEQAIHL
tara:strand:+ start:2696 stop:3436 length:741 start_codon:yes stop_codon:yes gene_type:complete